MSTMTFETDACIGPGGLLDLGVMPFPEGWLVHVKVEPAAASLHDLNGAGRREMALAALQRIAGRGGISGIPDPVAWQREQRAERNLPGREP